MSPPAVLQVYAQAGRGFKDPDGSIHFGCDSFSAGPIASIAHPESGYFFKTALICSNVTPAIASSSSPMVSYLRR